MHEFHKDNHYIPQFYLKNWSHDGKRVWVYRTLVSNKDVSIWSLKSIKGIAYISHLYTRSFAGKSVDDFECWLNREFETPATEALRKATLNQHLKIEDWNVLVRFAAAQIVRTPAFYIRHINWAKRKLPGIMNKTLQNLVCEFENKNTLKKMKNCQEKEDDFQFPIKIKVEPSDISDKSLIKAEAFIGRDMWLLNIHRLLTKTIKVLSQHKWSILYAAEGIKWVTSDDPVICLNYYNDNKYDFGGGWGRKGSEIIFPLSPQHILYTQIGKKNSSYKDISFELSLKLQKIISEHSHRIIFSEEKIDYIKNFRQRTVDEKQFNYEKELWLNFNINQRL